MKKYLIIFLILLMGLSFVSVYNQYSRQEFRRIRNLEEEFAELFMIPDDIELMIPEVTYPLLFEIVEDLEVNIFRTSQISENEIHKFVLLTNETEFFDHLTIKSGSRLSIADTQDHSLFLSTIETGDPNQIGHVTYFGDTAAVTIAPLITAFQTLPVAGRYFAELPTNVDLETFLQSFASRINEVWEAHHGEPLRIPYEIQDFIVEDNSNESTSFHLQTTDEIVVLTFIMTLVTGIYYIASQGKKISILKLNGFSDGKIWNAVVVKLVNQVFSLTIGVSLVISLILASYYQNFNFMLSIIIRQLFMYGIMLFFSLSIFINLKRIPISQGVKNRNDTYFVFKLNTILKMGLTVIVLFIGSSIVQTYEGIRQQETALKNWEVSESFGVFGAWYFGNDDTEELWEAQEWTIMNELYPIINQMGGILAEFYDYTEDQLEDADLDYINRIDDYNIRYGRVNLNYLESFPLLDIYNQPIVLNENDGEMIILVPEKYKQDEEWLLEFFMEERERPSHYNLDFEVDSGWDEGVRIIWLKNDQPVFSFHPNVFPGNNNEILNPIIQVITETNSFAYERQSVLGQGGRDPMKIKLIDNDPIQTREVLEPKLRELGLDDNLRQIIAVNEAILNQISDLRIEVNLLMFILGMVSIMVLGLALQNTVLFFNFFRQKFVINRVFGIGFFRTYRNYYYYLGKIWLTKILIVIVAAWIFNLHLLWSLCFFLGGVEVFLSILTIFKLEKQNKMVILKGEE